MKVLIGLSLPLAVILWVLPWKERPHELPMASYPAASISVEEAQVAPKIWTDATVIYKGDSFSLHFRTPNAPYLGVVDPKGRFFYIVFPQESALGDLKPLVDSKHFAQMQTLKIGTALKADPYTYGVYENQPVFTCSGTYTFLLGENLHIDDPAFLSKVTIQYIHKPRPAHTVSSVAMN